MTSLRRILAGLSKLEQFDIHLLTYSETLKKKGPQFISEGYTVHGHGQGEHNIAYLQYVSAMNEVLELCKKYDFKLLVAFFAHMPMLIMATASATLKIPYVLCARGSDIYVNMQSASHRKIMRRYVHRARAVITVSEQMEKRMNRWRLLKRNQKVISIPNSIHLRPFERAWRIKKKGNTRFDFLFSGTARPVKRFDSFLNAAAMVKRRAKKKPRFGAILVPHRRHPELIQHYIHLVREKKIDDCIEFLEPQSHSRLINIYGVSKCCVIPSDSEGCSNTMLEAMASGCHIIARDSLMPNYLVSRHNRLFRSDEELAQHMLEMLDWPPICVRENMERIRKWFHPRNEIEAYANLFGKILKGTPSDAD